MIKVGIVDDHAIVRQGLRTLLEGQDGCVVLGEAADGLTALLNRDPTPSPQTNTGLDANPARYDLLGRFYHVGVRYAF